MARWWYVFLLTCFLSLGQAQVQAADLAGKVGAGTPPATGQPGEKQDPVIVADKSELTITGWHGTGSYSRSVWLTAKSEGVIKVIFMPSDLTREKDGKIVDHSVLTADNDIQLTPDMPKNIKITVNGIEEPGTYLGQVEFRPQGGAPGKTLPLTLIVKAPQPLAPLPGTDQLKLNLSSPGWMSKFLLPAAETVGTRVLQFKNPFQVPVKLEKAWFVLNGEAGNQLISSKKLKVENSGKPSSDPIVDYTLILGTPFIHPDKYIGNIYLKFEGAKDLLPLPVAELTMRYGPARALLLLFIGIPIGVFLLFMKTTGLALAEFDRYLDDLQDRVNQTAPVDRAILQPMLDSVDSQVEDKTIKPEAGQEELKNIRNRLSLLVRLEAIEQKLEDPENGILSEIKAIRGAIKQKKDQEGQQNFDALEALISTQRAASQAYDIMKEAPVPEPAMQEAPSSPIKKGLKTIGRFFIKWILPFLYYLLAVLVLAGVGLITLYLKNATFGANPLADYAGLILWGLGSNVASFNIQAVLPGGRT